MQVYPWAVAPHELETPLQTFKTWRSVSNGPFIFNARPLGDPKQDPCARPFIFFLDRVLDSQTDATLTLYTRFDNTSTVDQPHQAQGESEAKCDKQGFSAASNIERIKIFASKMDPFLWKQVQT